MIESWVKFTVNCGLLKITLTQTGESIKSISVSDDATMPNTYSLDCGSGVSIASGATFYIAVPAGTYTTFQFTNGTDVVRGRAGLSIAVVENHIKPVSSNFAPKYTSGTTDADYGIKVGDNWWAPVNCGYEPANGEYKGYKYGKLYQWGRVDGQGYDSNDATYPSGDNLPTGPISNIPTSSDAEKFYKVTSFPYNWYSGSSPAANDLWKEDGSTIYDPCPEGWRVPTMSELDRLAGGDGTGSASLGGSGWDSTNKGYWFNGTSSPASGTGLFLPAAGCRDYDDGSARNRGYYGDYWSSSVDGYYARYLYFYDDDADMRSYCRADGYSVRCVQE